LSIKDFAPVKSCAAQNGYLASLAARRANVENGTVTQNSWRALHKKHLKIATAVAPLGEAHTGLRYTSMEPAQRNFQRKPDVTQEKMMIAKTTQNASILFVFRMRMPEIPRTEIKLSDFYIGCSSAPTADHPILYRVAQHNISTPISQKCNLDDLPIVL
jgi:hypothetical protein